MSEIDIKRIEEFGKSYSLNKLDNDTTLAIITLTEYKKQIRDKVDDMKECKTVDSKYNYVLKMLLNHYPNMSVKKVSRVLLKHGYLSTNWCHFIIVICAIILGIALTYTSVFFIKDAHITDYIVIAFAWVVPITVISLFVMDVYTEG